MRSLICLVVSCLFCVQAHPTRARDECRLEIASTVPLSISPRTGKLDVEAMVERVPVHMVVDTGSEGLLLSDEVARKSGRRFEIGGAPPGTREFGTAFASGIGGSRAGTIIDIPKFSLGSLHGDFRGTVVEDPQMFAVLGADGLLGMSFLENFDIDFDLDGNQLRLFRAVGECAQPAVALAQPLYAVTMAEGYRGNLRVQVPVLINGVALTALLDTGSPDTLLLHSAATRLGLAAGQERKIQLRGVGGRRIGFAEVLQSMTLGPITLRNVRATVTSDQLPGVDLLLGLSLFRKIHIWVSNSSRTVVMQYPPVRSPALDH